MEIGLYWIKIIFAEYNNEINNSTLFLIGVDPVDTWQAEESLPILKKDFPQYVMPIPSTHILTSIF